MSLEVFKEKTEQGTRCPGLVDGVVLGHRLDSMTSELFSNLFDSVILRSDGSVRAETPPLPLTRLTAAARGRCSAKGGEPLPQLRAGGGGAGPLSRYPRGAARPRCPEVAARPGHGVRQRHRGVLRCAGGRASRGLPRAVSSPGPALPPSLSSLSAAPQSLGSSRGCGGSGVSAGPRPPERSGSARSAEGAGNRAGLARRLGLVRTAVAVRG